MECAETTHRGHAIGLTRHLVESSDVDHIWVVGGDGTMNEAINGYLNDDGRVHREGVSIGGIPAGTGGDFARTTGMRSLIGANRSGGVKRRSSIVVSLNLWTIMTVSHVGSFSISPALAPVVL